MLFFLSSKLTSKSVFSPHCSHLINIAQNIRDIREEKLTKVYKFKNALKVNKNGSKAKVIKSSNW